MLAAPESESCPETALLGLLEGLRHARAHGAPRVTVVVADRTLAGYLWHGWRPASLRMHQALRHFLQAAEGAITNLHGRQNHAGNPSFRDLQRRSPIFDDSSDGDDGTDIGRSDAAKQQSKRRRSTR